MNDGTWVVKWETLNGNIKTETFKGATAAESLYDRVSNRPGTQWVDIEFVDD